MERELQTKTVDRPMDPNYELCQGASCLAPKPVPNKPGWFVCKETDTCKHKSCECNMFSYDPDKPKDPYKREAGPGQEFEKEHGRDLICRCSIKRKKK